MLSKFLLIYTKYVDLLQPRLPVLGKHEASVFNRDADKENDLVDIVGDGEGGANWESSADIYILLLFSH